MGECYFVEYIKFLVHKMGKHNPNRNCLLVSHSEFSNNPKCITYGQRYTKFGMSSENTYLFFEYTFLLTQTHLFEAKVQKQFYLERCRCIHKKYFMKSISFKFRFLIHLQVMYKTSYRNKLYRFSNKNLRFRLNTSNVCHKRAIYCLDYLC